MIDDILFGHVPFASLVARRLTRHKCFCQWVPRRLQEVSGTGPARNSVGWKAVRGAIVA